MGQAQVPVRPLRDGDRGAVARARSIKPEIPEAGEHGIALRDELDLIRSVPLCAGMSGQHVP